MLWLTLDLSLLLFSRSVISDSFETPRTAALQASLSFTISQSLLKLMSIESVMPSNHLILCRPLLLPPSIFPSIRVFPNESVLCIRWLKYWSFSFSTGHLGSPQLYPFLRSTHPLHQPFIFLTLQNHVISAVAEGLHVQKCSAVTVLNLKSFKKFKILSLKTYFASQLGHWSLHPRLGVLTCMTSHILGLILGYLLSHPLAPYALLPFSLSKNLGAGAGRAEVGCARLRTSRDGVISTPGWQHKGVSSGLPAWVCILGGESHSPTHLQSKYHIQPNVEV